MRDGAESCFHGQLSHDGVVVDADVVAYERVGVDHNAVADSAILADSDVFQNNSIMTQERTSADFRFRVNKGTYVVRVNKGFHRLL